MKAAPTIQKELNCANWQEVVQRCQFQDWVTQHLGYLRVNERDRLWARFKRGMMIHVEGGEIKWRSVSV